MSRVAWIGLLVVGCAQPVVEEPAPGATIGVSGEWALEVREADGGVVERRQFHNTYYDPLNAFASLIGSASSPGYWTVKLGSGVITGAGGPCYNGGGDDGGPCLISESAWTSHSYEFPNLTKQVGTRQVQLAGTMTALNDGEITTVETLMSTCGATVAPADCGYGAGQGGMVTSHSITPLAMVENQSLYVTFTLSFTAAP